MEKEIWKDIPKFEGYYQISNLGNIRSLDRVVTRKHLHPNKITGVHIKYSINTKGYIYARVNVNAKKTIIYPHRYVALLFIPNPENKPEVNHKKGIKKDNRASELEWVTRKENMRHAMDTGLNDSNGEKSGKAKLKNEDIINIRNEYKGKYGQYCELGRRYGVSNNNIKDIVNRVTWRHI